MKIKRKVEMTHEEYAKYMIDKFGIDSYERELIDNNIFDAPMKFEQTFTLKPMRKDDDPVIQGSFRGVVIEVEEEIDENTEFEHLIEVTKDEFHIKWSDSSVAGQMMPVSKEYHAYIDGEFKLIWTHEKGLVE